LPLVRIQALGEIAGGAVQPLVRFSMTVGKIEGAGVPMKSRRRIHPARFFRLKIILRRAGIEPPRPQIVAAPVALLHPQHPVGGMHDLGGFQNDVRMGRAIGIGFAIDAPHTRMTACWLVCGMAGSTYRTSVRQSIGFGGVTPGVPLMGKVLNPTALPPFSLAYISHASAS